MKPWVFGHLDKMPHYPVMIVCLLRNCDLRKQIEFFQSRSGSSRKLNRLGKLCLRGVIVRTVDVDFPRMDPCRRRQGGNCAAFAFRVGKAGQHKELFTIARREACFGAVLYSPAPLKH
jgi:hypothetical protein